MRANQSAIDPDKVAIYVRWSTEDQGEGTTLAVQLEGCKHYVLSQGWNVNEHLIFVDDGYSGGDLGRPAMNQLRKAVAQGRVDCVVVYKLDRLSRSVIDTVNLVLDEWEDRTFLKSAREPVDTTSPMGKQFFYMLVSYAEWERNVIKDRTFSGKLKRAQEGRNPGFKPPYGYRTGESTGTFEIVPHEADVVRAIFEGYRRGKGAQALAYELNAQGIPFRHGRVWNDSTIFHILKNPLYLGHLVWGRLQRNHRRSKRPEEPFWLHNETPLASVKDAEVPPIVSEEMFQVVQRLRESRNVRKSGVSGRALSSPHLLTGLATCRCGHSLSGEKQKRGNNYAYYKCKGARTKGPEFCPAGYIRQDLLDQQVVSRLRARFLDPGARDELMALLDEHHQAERHRLQQVVTELGAQLAGLDAQLERIERDYRSGELSAGRYERLSDQVEADRKRLREALSSRQQELDNLQAQAIDPKEIERFRAELAHWEELTVEEQKSLLRHWVEQITVFKHKDEPDVTVDIVYKWEADGKPEPAFRAV